MARSGGKRSVAVVPSPGELLISNEPPWASMKDLVSGSPGPVPS